MTAQTFHPELYAGKVALVVGGTTGIGAAIAITGVLLPVDGGYLVT